MVCSYNSKNLSVIHAQSLTINQKMCRVTDLRTQFQQITSLRLPAFLPSITYNHGQKSWDKFTFVAFFHTCQTNSQARIHLRMFSPPPPPHLQCWKRVHAISLNVQHCTGGEGGKQRILKRKTVLFLKLCFKHTEN